MEVHQAAEYLEAILNLEVNLNNQTVEADRGRTRADLNPKEEGMCEAIMRVIVGHGRFKQTWETCPNHPGTKLRGEAGCPFCGMEGIRSLNEPFWVKAQRRGRRRQLPTG